MVPGDGEKPSWVVARQNSDPLLNHGNKPASGGGECCSLIQAYDPFLMSKRQKSHVFGRFAVRNRAWIEVTENPVFQTLRYRVRVDDQMLAVTRSSLRSSTEG